MKIVVKIGTSTLAHSTGRLNIRQVTELCRTISDIKNAGNDIVLVSSGAIGMGVGKLNLKSRPSDIPTKQAAAAVGQCELMYTYDRLFADYGHTVGQILLTRQDMENEKSHNNFKNTINRLLELQVLPIVNENDTVSTEELGIGDNDTLAAQVAVTVKADLLILLSDIDGLYTCDPHKDPNAKLLSRVEQITPEILAFGDDKFSELGTGGMRTKLHAALIATQAGSDMVITNGANAESLYDIINGADIGTRFIGRKS